jgi:XRE family aerobic/anaerobic benzoate catabolism transcriptional regulator
LAAFELFGQETFRRNERSALEAVLERHARFVLATGGGLVTEPPTFELLASSCRTVWVKTTPEEHMRRVIEQGDFRPMADNDQAMEDLILILASRQPLYAKADLILDTTGKDVAASLTELLALLAEIGAPFRRYA